APPPRPPPLPDALPISGQPGGTVPSGDPAPLDAAGPEPDVPFAEPFDGCEQEAPSLRSLPAPMTPHRATPSQGLRAGRVRSRLRSEEHTSETQSRFDLV